MFKRIVRLDFFSFFLLLVGGAVFSQLQSYWIVDKLRKQDFKKDEHSQLKKWI